MRAHLKKAIDDYAVTGKNGKDRPEWLKSQRRPTLTLTLTLPLPLTLTQARTGRSGSSTTSRSWRS